MSGLFDAMQSGDPDWARKYVSDLAGAKAAEPEQSALIVPTKAEAARVLRNPRSERFGGADLRVKAETDEQKRVTDFERRRRIARETLASERRPADAERKAKLRGRVMTSEQLDDVPDLEPLIDRWIYKGTLAQVFGPSGNYKTFVAADMARAICTGTRWHGYEAKQGKVLYIVGEGVQGFRARVRAMEAARSLGRIEGLGIVNGAVQIGGPEWSELIEVVAEDGYDLVIVDTQARATVGRKENDNSDMGEVVAALDWLIEATSVGVLMVHHSGKSGEDDRGASSVKAALQTQIKVTKGKGLVAKVEQTKQKDHEEIKNHELHLEPFGDSLVIVPNSPGTDRTKEREETKATLRRKFEATDLEGVECSKQILMVLVAMFGGGMGASKSEATNALRDTLTGIGVPVSKSFRNTVYSAWSKLEAAGHLLPNPNNRTKFLASQGGCKAVGMVFQRPAWVSEDEWEEAIEQGEVEADPTDFEG